MKTKIMGIVTAMMMVGTMAVAQTADECAQEMLMEAYQLNEAENYNEALNVAQKGLQTATSGEMKAALCNEISHSYRGMKNDTKSIEYLNKGLVWNPYDEQLLYNLGVALYENGSMDQAARWFDKVIDLSKTTEVRPFFLSGAYEYRADIAKGNGQTAMAEDYFAKSIATSPDPLSPANETSYFGLADIYYDQGRYADAAEYFEKGIALEPLKMNNVRRAFELSECYRLTQNTEARVVALKKSIKAYFANREMLDGIMENFGQDDKEAGNMVMVFHMMGHYAIFELGMVGYWTGDLKTALDNFRYFINSYEGFVSYIAPSAYQYAPMAWTFNEAGEKELAAKALKMGYAIDANDAELMFIDAFTRGNSDTETLRLYKKILEQEHTYKPQNFDYATVYNNIAWWYRQNNRSREGLPYAEKSIKINPNNSNTWETLGEIYYEVGQYQKCIDAMERCRSDYKEEAEKYINMARGKMK